MKTLRIVLMLALILTTTLAVSAQKKGEKTVVYNATLHCESCKAKVEKNLPYEKGVKDMKIDMKAQTITVTFRDDKNTTEGIQKAIEKLSIPVAGVATAGAEKCTKDCTKTDKKCEGKCGEKCCSKTGGDCCKDKK